MEPVEKETEQLLDAEQLAKYLQLNVQTVYRIAARGEIPCIRVSRKILRFKKSDIDRWLSDRTEGGEK